MFNNRKKHSFTRTTKICTKENYSKKYTQKIKQQQKKIKNSRKNFKITKNEKITRTVSYTCSVCVCVNLILKTNNTWWLISITRKGSEIFSLGNIHLLLPYVRDNIQSTQTQGFKNMSPTGHVWNQWLL